MLIHTSFALQGSDSRDWSRRPYKTDGGPDGGQQAIPFAIKLPVRYQVGGESGWGEIVSISSGVALFTTDRALALDTCAEVYIKWPVLLLDSVQLSLIASGTIIRIEPGSAALSIDKHEFRTCVASFFHRSQPGQVKSKMADLQAPHRATPGAAGWLEGAQRKPEAERTQPQRRPGRQAAAGDESSKSSHQRKLEGNNARWEQVFQEKFADPEYYVSRSLPHSSPKADF